MMKKMKLATKMKMKTIGMKKLKVAMTTTVTIMMSMTMTKMKMKMTMMMKMMMTMIKMMLMLKLMMKMMKMVNRRTSSLVFLHRNRGILLQTDCCLFSAALSVHNRRIFIAHLHEAYSFYSLIQAISKAPLRSRATG